MRCFCRGSVGWGEGMRSAVLGKVREYRWELWLFFGVGVVVSIVGSLVQIAVGFFIYRKLRMVSLTVLHS